MEVVNTQLRHFRLPWNTGTSSSSSFLYCDLKRNQAGAHTGSRDPPTSDVILYKSPETSPAGGARVTSCISALQTRRHRAFWGEMTWVWAGVHGRHFTDGRGHTYARHCCFPDRPGLSLARLIARLQVSMSRRRRASLALKDSDLIRPLVLVAFV